MDRKHLLSKELVSLAGEYAVATELCRRGLYSQLTLGNRKRTDILIEADRRMVRIQVKTKQTSEWPSVAGLYRDDEFLVFVDFQSKEEGQPPDYYVLDLNDWVAVVRPEKKRYPEVRIDSQNRITYADGWKGLNVRPAMIHECRDRWDKILTGTGEAFEA